MDFAVNKDFISAAKPSLIEAKKLTGPDLSLVSDSYCGSATSQARGTAESSAPYKSVDQLPHSKRHQSALPIAFCKRTR